VFVTGATGFIGGEVSKALRRAGFTVYGLVRSETKATSLRQHEIIPVFGELSQADSYRGIVERCQIIVDCANDYSLESDRAAPNRKLLETVEESSTPKLHIYTSGLLVYGHTEGGLVDENSPTNHKMLQWRVEFEKQFIGSEKVVGVVIRPGFVYGSSGSFTASFFNIKSDTLVIRGKKDKRWSWVHIHDLTDVYLRVINSERSKIKGEIFNIGEKAFPPTYEELVLKAAKHSGFNGKVEYADPIPSDWVSTFADCNVVVNPQKAIDRLGWKPTHLPFLEDLDVYYAAIKASQS